MKEIDRIGTAYFRKLLAEKGLTVLPSTPRKDLFKLMQEHRPEYFEAPIRYYNDWNMIFRKALETKGFSVFPSISDKDILKLVWEKMPELFTIDFDSEDTAIHLPFEK